MYACLKGGDSLSFSLTCSLPSSIPLLSPPLLYEVTATRMEPETSQGPLPRPVSQDDTQTLGWERTWVRAWGKQRRKTGRPERQDTLDAHPRLIRVTENPTDGKRDAMHSHTVWVHNQITLFHFPLKSLPHLKECNIGLQMIKQVNPKGNQHWIFTERTDAETEAPILWPPDAKSWLTGKHANAGKD